jgi:hypothetical protein
MIFGSTFSLLPPTLRFFSPVKSEASIILSKQGGKFKAIVVKALKQLDRYGPQT